VTAIDASTTLRGRDLLSAADVSAEEILRVFATAERLKAEFREDRRHAAPPLVGRTIALLFQKPSLRTRVTFEAGMAQLGGAAIYLPEDTVMGAREAVRDVARNLERFVDGIVARTGPHEVVAELAAQAAIPVINGLTLREHPCQALADAFTIREHLGRLEGAVVTFVGDGNNVYHSLALVGAALGMEVRLAHPPRYGPDERIVLLHRPPHRGRAHHRSGRRPHLGHQLRAQLVQPIRGQRRGLVHQLHRARLERGHRQLTLFARTAHHHHARRGRPRQRAQHPQPVQVRHHQIQRHHVWLQRGDLLQRVQPVARGVHHGDARRGGEHLPQHLAREGRVIHDQHPDRRVCHELSLDRV
jgi:aspartate carbamoyltransferase catalytic subunit